MSVMKRMSMIFKAKANKALDRAEDPRETLDYSYQRQLEMLQKVRRGVADVATSRKRLELQISQLEREQQKRERLVEEVKFLEPGVVNTAIEAQVLRSRGKALEVRLEQLRQLVGGN